MKASLPLNGACLLTMTQLNSLTGSTSIYIHDQLMKFQKDNAAWDNNGMDTQFVAKGFNPFSVHADYVQGRAKVARVTNLILPQGAGTIASTSMWSHGELPSLGNHYCQGELNNCYCCCYCQCCTILNSGVWCSSLRLVDGIILMQSFEFVRAYPVNMPFWSHDISGSVHSVSSCAGQRMLNLLLDSDLSFVMQFQQQACETLTSMLHACSTPSMSHLTMPGTSCGGLMTLFPPTPMTSMDH